MGIFKRIGDVFKSNVNDILDKAEDPRKMIEQTILDMQKTHANSKTKLIESMTLLKQEERFINQQKEASASWEAKAIAALKSSNEELAKKALTEKQKIDTDLGSKEIGVSTQKKMVEDLKQSLKTLEQKIEDTKKKRDLLLTRLKQAESKKRQSDLLQSKKTKVSAAADQSAFSTFDRMVEKIERNESEVEAYAELSGHKDTDEAKEIAQEFQRNQEDDLLAQLKKKMAAGNPVEQSTSTPEAGAEVLENELDALKKLVAESNS